MDLDEPLIEFLCAYGCFALCSTHITGTHVFAPQVHDSFLNISSNTSPSPLANACTRHFPLQKTWITKLSR